MKIFTCILIVLAGVSLRAQSVSPDLGKIPPPSAPFVAPVPENAEWTVAVRPSRIDSKDSAVGEAAAGEGGVPNKSVRTSDLTEIRSAKSGPVKRDIATYRQRPEKVFYFYDDNIITLRSNNRDYAVVDAKAVMAVGPEVSGIYRELGNITFSPGFPGFDWLQLKYYEGVVLWDKKIPCYHYVIKGAHGSGAGEAKAEAWVDVKTGLPVSFSWNGMDYVFSFHGEPNPPVTLPAAAQEALR